jgi:hypothetical protein
MNLIMNYDELFAKCRPHFKQQRTFDRARALAFSSLITLGRHTISRMICSKNEQQQDWSADYLFFSRARWHADDLFSNVLSECAQNSHWYQNSILIAMDDTAIKKTGKKIAEAATLRDPLSLPYHVNLMKALRFIQASALINPEERMDTARAIPVLFTEAGPAKKPKKNAPEEVKENFKREQKAKRLSVQGHQAILKLREQVDRLPDGKDRLLFATVDGSYCNANFLRDLPENIVVVARARKDISIFAPVADKNAKGRRRKYGDRLPTPEEIRKDDDNCPWQTVNIYAAGKNHDLRYKTIAPVLWKKGTGSKPCRLIIIAPLRYRRNKTAKLLYRDPAYLLCLHPEVPVEVVLQYYFFRWDIEVNNRDEKSLLGVGDAQVRSPNSVKANPQFSVFAYSLLLLAAVKAYGAERTDDYLPLAKWRSEEIRRPSTLDIISQLRREILYEQLNIELQIFQRTTHKKRQHHKRPKSKIEARKRGFAVAGEPMTTRSKLPVNILAALLYAES